MIRFRLLAYFGKNNRMTVEFKAINFDYAARAVREFFLILSLEPDSMTIRKVKLTAVKKSNP